MYEFFGIASMILLFGFLFLAFFSLGKDLLFKDYVCIVYTRERLSNKMYRETHFETAISRASALKKTRKLYNERFATEIVRIEII